MTQDETTLGRVTLIGTGHVFQIEQTIRDAITALRPDVVFIELDKGRLMALLHRRQTGKMPPVRGNFIHRKLAAFQESMATRYGGEVGGEMLAAFDAARAIGARISLIDQGADQTVAKALKQLTWRERLRAVGYMISGAFNGLRKKADVDDQVQQYQQDPVAALAELEDKFPTLYRVVIDERDELMSARIRVAMHEQRHGVAVVGDGHVEGMQRRLADMLDQAYRLEAVRAGDLPKPSASDYSFSVTLEAPSPVDGPEDPPQSS